MFLPQPLFLLFDARHLLFVSGLLFLERSFVLYELLVLHIARLRGVPFEARRIPLHSNQGLHFQLLLQPFDLLPLLQDYRLCVAA